MLTNILEEDKNYEIEINRKVFECIDYQKNFIFNAGAGAGKTYSLIAAIKYLLDTKGDMLKKQKNNVLCITYTNVAMKEIKEKLGNTSIVKVSTIHEYIWEIIKKYQPQLVKIHHEKLVNEITSLKRKMDSESEYKEYKKLTEGKKALFCNIMFGQTELFNKSYNKSATDFRKAFNDILNDFGDIIKNVNNFKKIVSAIYRLERYETRYNSDMLHKMRISHDTLLEYANQLIQEYDLLKQIIIDKHPYIFVDEYQDTNKNVIEILNSLSIYSPKIKHPLCIGYFGDTIQNIYDDGIGEHIHQYTMEFEQIDKEYNRRSMQEIIDVGNKIRQDKIRQKSIYEDCTGGVVEFYVGKPELREVFIEKCIKEWNISLENPLHCFVLTNKTVAEYSGFSDIYNIFKDTDLYKGKKYEQLNTELLSDDIKKLGEVQLILFRIVELSVFLKEGKTQIERIIPSEVINKLNLDLLKRVIALLKGIEGETLYEYIDSFIEISKQDDSEICSIILRNIFDMNDVTIELFKKKLIEILFADEENAEEVNKKIDELININMEVYLNWYKCIINDVKSKIVYHTYHGTKGLEFDNVLIIMENSFGRSKEFFNNYFKNYNPQEDRNLTLENNLVKARNLLYVSITRAIKNLRIFYIDEVNDFEENLKHIFNEVHYFEE